MESYFLGIDRPPGFASLPPIVFWWENARCKQSSCIISQNGMGKCQGRRILGSYKGISKISRFPGHFAKGGQYTGILATPGIAVLPYGLRILSTFCPNAHEPGIWLLECSCRASCIRLFDGLSGFGFAYVRRCLLNF